MAQPRRIRLVGVASPGVKRMAVLRNNLTTTDRWSIFLSILLISWVYGLEGLLRYVYQAYATVGFRTHSALATVGVLRSVIATVAQPTAARIADVLGRLELVVVSVVFYVVGTIIDATSRDVESFSTGGVIYQIGYTSIILLIEVIIADITTLENRLIFSYVPVLPFLVNTWISGNISEAILRKAGWRWGVGMWGIIYTVSAIPLIVALWMLKVKGVWKALFWQLDVTGLILMITSFALILVPFKIAGGSSAQWEKPKVVAPLVIGGVLLPVWIWWEQRAEYPLVPFRLLKDRGVWGALGIACMLTFCWYLQGDFLFTVLIVSFGESIESATRITSLYSFCSVLTGTIVGIIVRKIRYLKPFIFAGCVLFVPAFGMLIHFRGGVRDSSHWGTIGAQMLLGVAGGLFAYPTQVAIQATTQHANVAVITGLYLATFNIGSALGNTVSGAIWTHTLTRSFSGVPLGFYWPPPC